MPPQAIKSADINKLLPKDQLKPFAKLHFNLMRTYVTPECTSEIPNQEKEGTNHLANVKKIFRCILFE